MRLGRSYTESVLRRPQVVFPPLGLQRISVTLAGRTRRQERVTHPRVSGPVVVFAATTAISPPVLVNLAVARPRRRTTYTLSESAVVTQPSTFMAAPIVASLSAVFSRSTGTRRFPLQGWEGSVVSLSPTAPSTPILDSANRPNENPIAGGWGAGIGATSSRFQIVSNIIRGTAAAGNNDQVWGTVFPRDQEVYATNLSNSDLRLYLRVTAEATGFFNGYEVQFFISSGTVTLRSFVAGVNNFSWPSITPAVAITSGDRVWVTVTQTGATTSRVNVYVDYGNLGDGNWKMIGSFIDLAVNAAFQGDGKIGAFLFDNSATRAFDNFGGGGIASFAPLGTFSRSLGPRPPMVVTMPESMTLVVALEQAVLRSAQRARHGPKSLLFPPTTLAQPPPNAPVSVNCLQPDRLARRHRRQLPSSSLGAPVVLRVFGELLTSSAQSRRSDTRAFLSPPTVVVPPAAFVAAQIQVTLTAVRSRMVGPRRFPLQGWDGTPSESVAAPGSYVAAILASAPSSWWRFDEAAGTTAVDQGGGHPGTYTGNFVLGEEGQLTGEPDTGISLGRSGGAADFVSMANTPIAMGQTNVTIEMWYTARLPNQGGELWSERGTTDQWVLLSSASGTGLAGLAFRYVDDAGVTNVNNSLGGVIGDGSRKHIVLVKTGLTFDAYVDGVKTGTVPAATLGPQTNTPITVKVGEGGGTTSMKGLFDEVAVYQRSLSAAEITAHYRAGAIGPTPPLQFVSRFLGPRPPRLILAISPKEVVLLPVVSMVPRDNVERRRPHSFLSVPQQLAQPPPSVATLMSAPLRTQNKTRRTTTRLAPPVVLQTFASGRPSLSTTRPRQVAATVFGPTVTSSAFVAEPVTVALARVRPRPVSQHLGRPQSLQTFAAARPVLSRLRPRATVYRLGSPQIVLVPSVEQRRRTVAAPLVRTRPRKTTGRVAPPTVVRVPAVEQLEQTIRAALVHARPRRTLARVVAPASLQTFEAGPVWLARIRPRPTAKSLAEPTVVRVPSVEQQEDTIRVSLVRARPRPTARRLGAPAALQLFSGPAVALTRVRPRPTSKLVGEPQAILVAAVEQALRTIRAPLVRIRPRDTAAKVVPPAAVRVPSVEQQENTVRVTLARIRPRPTTRTLGKPVALQAFYGPAVYETRIRPRPTTRRLFAPAVVAPQPTQDAQTVTVWLAGRTRVEAPRRAPIADLRPPTVIVVNPPVVTDLAVTLAEPRNRRDVPRRFPLQGHTGQPIRETGSTVTRAAFMRVIGPKPPVIIGPLPTPQQQTVTVHTSLRRQVEAVRRAPVSVLRKPTRVTAFVAPSIDSTLVGVRTRRETQRLRTTYRLQPPTVVSIRPTLEQQTVAVALVRARPRPTVHKLGAPTALRTFRTGTAALVRSTPRPTVHAVRPPTVVRVPAVEQAQRTIRVSLVSVRPRKTTLVLRAPVAVRVFVADPISVTVARVRPGRIHSAVRVPATLQTIAPPTRVALAPARRPRTHSRIAAPTKVNAAVPVALTIAVWLVAVKTRLLHRPVKHIQPQIIPVTPAVIDRDGWTDTRTTASSAATGTTVAPSVSEGGTAASAAAEGRDAADAATTIGTVKTDAAEISDKRSGT